MLLQSNNYADPTIAVFSLTGSSSSTIDTYAITVTYLSGDLPSADEPLAMTLIKYGPIGYSGSSGFIGSRGYIGSLGYTGSQGVGYTGSQSYTGSFGYAGSLGYVGSQGPIGYSGSQSYTGSVGYIGSLGYNGSRGYTGSQSYTGSQGVTGYTGSQGGVVVTADSASALLYPTMVTAVGTTSDIRITSDKLYFNPNTGILNATDFNSFSDRILKDNIIPLEDSVNIINQLIPVSFNWKESGKKSLGFIAQDIEKILPYIVETNNNIKSVSYVQIVALLVDVVKSQGIELAAIKEKLGLT
jgi:hypothetical protein